MTETEEKVIDDVLAAINKHGIEAKQSSELFEHLGRIVEMGMSMTREGDTLTRTDSCLVLPLN